MVLIILVQVLGALLWVAILIKMDISYTIACCNNKCITGFYLLLSLKLYQAYKSFILFVQGAVFFVIYFGFSMDKWQDTF